MRRPASGVNESTIPCSRGSSSAQLALESPVERIEPGGNDRFVIRDHDVLPARVELAVLPGPHRHRDAGESAEHEPFEAVAKSLLEQIELEKRPHRPKRQIAQPKAPLRPGQPRGLERRVMVELVEKDLHSGDRVMPERVLQRSAATVQIDRLVNQAGPTAGIAAEQAQGLVVLSAGKAELDGPGSRSGSARGTRDRGSWDRP